MLVLTRAPGERIRLRTAAGEEVWVSVRWSPYDRRFRVAIDAPSSVEVLREELITPQAGSEAR